MRIDGELYFPTISIIHINIILIDVIVDIDNDESIKHQKQINNSAAENKCSKFHFLFKYIFWILCSVKSLTDIKLTFFRFD